MECLIGNSRFLEFHFFYITYISYIRMSLLRTIQFTRSSFASLTSRPVITGLCAPLIQRRSYWWKRGPKDDDKPKKEEKKEEEKTEPDKEKKESKPVFQPSARRPYRRNIVEKSLVFDADIDNPELGKMAFGESPVVLGGGGGNDMDYNFNIKDFFHLHYEVNDSLILPAIPLPTVPLLPGVIQKFTVTDRLTIQKLKEIQPKDNIIGLFLQKNPPKYTTSVVNDLSEIYPIGTYLFPFSLYFQMCRVPRPPSDWQQCESHRKRSGSHSNRQHGGKRSSNDRKSLQTSLSERKPRRDHPKGLFERVAELCGHADGSKPALQAAFRFLREGIRRFSRPFVSGQSGGVYAVRKARRSPESGRFIVE